MNLKTPSRSMVKIGLQLLLVVAAILIITGYFTGTWYRARDKYNEDKTTVTLNQINIAHTSSEYGSFKIVYLIAIILSIVAAAIPVIKPNMLINPVLITSVLICLIYVVIAYTMKVRQGLNVINKKWTYGHSYGHYGNRYGTGFIATIINIIIYSICLVFGIYYKFK